MSKIKIVGISLVVLALFGASGFGLWQWSGQGKQPVRTSLAISQSGSGGQTLGKVTDPNSISLTGNQAKTEPPSGLSVSQNSAANNLGQLTPNSDSSSGQSASKASTPDPFDPTTFAQYDKYKDGNGALFGDVQVGTGTELGNNMKAAVYYKGWLTDGTLFDMSRADDKGQLQPFIFTLGAHQVIPGWEQALAGMKVGGTRLVIVPPAVGYGQTGQGPIPGNAVLVFQVQLLDAQ